MNKAGMLITYILTIKQRVLSEKNLSQSRNARNTYCNNKAKTYFKKNCDKAGMLVTIILTIIYFTSEIL